jgi:UPF0271 protein
VAALAHAASTELRHVKPHGALYTRAAGDAVVAASIAAAVRRVSRDLVLVGLAGSVMLQAGRDVGLRVAAEAFADRAYEPDGRLRPRSLGGAVLDDPAAAARQAVRIATTARVTCVDGPRSTSTRPRFASMGTRLERSRSPGPCARAWTRRA